MAIHMRTSGINSNLALGRVEVSVVSRRATIQALLAFHCSVSSPVSLLDLR